MIWTTKDGKKIEISSMTTNHLENAIKHLETRFLMPGFKRDDTLKLVPNSRIVLEYEEMKKVLSERKLDENHEKIIDRYKKSTINILEFL